MSQIKIKYFFPFFIKVNLVFQTSLHISCLPPTEEMLQTVSFELQSADKTEDIVYETQLTEIEELKVENVQETEFNAGEKLVHGSNDVNLTSDTIDHEEDRDELGEGPRHMKDELAEDQRDTSKSELNEKQQSRKKTKTKGCSKSPGKFSCTICDLTFRSHSFLLSHFTVKHCGKEILDTHETLLKMRSDLPKNREYVCAVCSKEVTNNFALKYHLISIHQWTEFLPKILHPFAIKQGSRREISGKQINQNALSLPFKCTICEKTISKSRWKAKLHLIGHFKADLLRIHAQLPVQTDYPHVKRYLCKICQYGTNTLGHFVEHLAQKSHKLLSQVMPEDLYVQHIAKGY